MQVELPRGWHASDVAVSAVSDPVVHLVVSSAPLEPAATDCQATSYAVADDAVAVVLLEWRGSETPPPRLQRLPERLDTLTLPLSRGAVECHAGRGGSVAFVEEGRALAAYVLLGARAPAALADKARELLETLRVEPSLPEPVELVPLAPTSLEHCRRSPLLAPVCPARVPRVGAPYLTHLHRDPHVGGRGEMHVFGLERGAESPHEPERNRPPAMAHVGLLAGDRERIAPWLERWDERARPLRNGLLHEERAAPVSFGTFDLGATRALLYLAPPFPHGGFLGNHLVLSWDEGRGRRAVSLHAWEPLTEAAAALLALARSAPHGKTGGG